MHVPDMGTNIKSVNAGITRGIVFKRICIEKVMELEEIVVGQKL